MRSSWAAHVSPIVLAAVVFVLTQAAGSALGQSKTAPRQTEQVTITVEQATPLKEVANQLQRRFGIPVSFEEVAWEYAGDIVAAGDVPELRAKGVSPQSQVPLAVRGTVSAKVSIDKQTKEPVDDPKQVLDTLVNDHKNRGNSGEFKVLNLGQAGFSIVPVQAREKGTGRLESQPSPFEASITFPLQERSVSATLELICGKVAEASGKSVVIGGTPAKLFDGTVVQTGGTGTARDFLAKALQDMHYTDPNNPGRIPAFSWRLLDDIRLRTYLLNIVGVYKDVPAPFGNGTATVQQPVFLPPR